MSDEFHTRVVLGAELESYTIRLPDHRIGRALAFPRKGVGEKGERFMRDASIGTEYNSRPFATIREGLFLLKAGLRKYSLGNYRRKTRSRRSRQLLLVGGWRDRYAGAHLHLSLAGERLTRERARRLAWHLHDHIPLLIAVGANSPVWGDEVTGLASNRITRASQTYFRVIHRKDLFSRSMDEMLYSRGRKTKPPTLELRVLDSNIPEFVMASACLVKAAALSWLAGNGAGNRISHAAYRKSREDAARRGMKAQLCWNGAWVPAPVYLDRFVWAHREALAKMDIPHEIWTTLKMLKRGYNGGRLLVEACRRAHEEHPPTWQQRFARRYTRALASLLSGNTIFDFARHLGVELPDLRETWLGRRRLRFL